MLILNKTFQSVHSKTWELTVSRTYPTIPACHQVKKNYLLFSYHLKLQGKKEFYRENQNAFSRETNHTQAYFISMWNMYLSWLSYIPFIIFVLYCPPWIVFVWKNKYSDAFHYSSICPPCIFCFCDTGIAPADFSVWHGR